MAFWIAWTLAFGTFVVAMILRWREARQLDRARAAQQRLVNEVQTKTGTIVDQTDLLDTRRFVLGWTRQEFWVGVATVAALASLVWAMLNLPLS